MPTSQPKLIVSEARQALSGASYCPKKLTALHTGIAAAASLAVALLSYLLSAGIGETGGLGGISSRAALETVQSLLKISLSVLGPFWSLGFLFAALLFARRQNPTPRSLLQGFRCWGPIVRMLLLQALIYFGVLFVSMQIGSFLYALTPFSNQLDEMLVQLSSGSTLDAEALNQLLAGMDTASLTKLLAGMLPFLLLPALVASIYLAYRLRLAQFLLMDRPELGAMFAITVSFRLTKGNCVKLLKLDLHFWWFYLLEVLVQVLCYGDLLLPLFGVTLSMNAVLASFLFYALALVCQVGLYAWKKPEIFTGYALFYDHLLPRQEADVN